MPTLLATYELCVDWNGDGDFSDAGEDISDDWMRISINRGYSSPLARFPTVGRMTVTLKNAAQTYSPPATAAARPRRAVRLRMTYGGTTKTLFRGWIESLRPSFGTRRDRRAVLECVDAVALLDQFEGDISLLTNVRADDIIEDVVGEVYTPPATNYQSGINLFATAADRWSGRLDAGRGMIPNFGIMQNIRASDKIQDAATSDWGRFFVSAAGTPTYYNRHQMPFDSTTALTLDDAMIEMDYEMSVTEIYNYVEVTCYPRKIGQVNEVLGELDQNNAPMIEAGDSVTFDIRFRDSANPAIGLGGLTVVTPVESTDFEATSDEPGEGDDVSSDITPSMTAYGDHAEITLANGGASPAYVQKLQVRGTAVRSQEPVTVVAEDATSQGLYEVRRLHIDAPLISSPIHAQNLANWLIDYYKDPLHNIRGVTIFANSNATHMAAVRDAELMQRVVLTESQTGLSAQAGYIYALRYDIGRGRIHSLSFDIEQAYDYGADPFTIGTSQLDGTDVIVY